MSFNISKTDLVCILFLGCFEMELNLVIRTVFELLRERLQVLTNEYLAWINFRADNLDNPLYVAISNNELSRILEVATTLVKERIRGEIARGRRERDQN